MGLGDFWLQFNKGKKQQLNDAQHGVRKEQVDSKFHNLFDIYDENGDGTLETNELEGIFKGIKKFAGADKILNSSENIQAKSIFAQQANIEDADFQGFVQSISTASEDIVSTSEKPTPDGGKEITTEYKDGSFETISYYPDGSYKFKKFDHEYTQNSVWYTINGDPNTRYTESQIDGIIRKDYQKLLQENKKALAEYKKNELTNRELGKIPPLAPPKYKDYKSLYMERKNICQNTSNDKYEIHDLELSDRAKFDVEVRKFLIEHFVETHQGAKDALDTMGILDDIGAAINTGAGELWNSIVNVYNKWFGDGTQEDYQNFYELVNKFNLHYDKSLLAKGDLEFMTNHPDAFFGSFETDMVENTGHQFELEKTVQFQNLTQQYQTATIYKQRIDLLKKALSEVDMYWAEQTALTNNPVQSDGLNPYTHIVSANNYLLAFFGNDQEAADMVLNGTIGNPDATMKKIKELMQDAQDALENALLKRTTTLESDETGSMTMSISSKGFEQYSYDELQAKYQSEYKEMYGVDFVPDELTEKVMGAKATGGMVKIAAITIISIIITRSPIMAEISGAAGGAAIEGASANLIRTLVTKYGQTAVQQGIKFAMTTGTLATDVGLTLLNQVTSERGVNGQELWESAKGSAKYIYFGAYIGSPVAQAVSQRISQIGVAGKLMSGGMKSTKGAIQTTTISGDKLLANISGEAEGILAKGKAFLKALPAKTGGFAADVGMFTGLEIATEGVDPLTAGAEQGEMLGKLKIMNHFLEYMLGAKTHTAVNRARWDVAVERAGVKNWNIKEIKAPSTDGKGLKTTYYVDIDGIPIGRFEDLNVLATAMMERVSAVYSTTPAPRQEAATDETAKPEPEIRMAAGETVESEVVNTSNDLMDASLRNPAQIAESRIREEWQQHDLGTKTPETEEPAIIFKDGKFVINEDLTTRQLSEPLPQISDEVTSLIFRGKLGQELTRRYEAASDLFSNALQKHKSEIQRLAIENKNNPQAFAQSVANILGKELGMEGLEPEVRIVADSEISGSGGFDWIDGRIEISDKITDFNQIVELVSHEFNHALQFADIVAQYGKDGIAELLTQNKAFMASDALTPEQKTEFIDLCVNSEYNQKLVESVKGKRAEEGSLNDYLRRIYKNEMTNVIDKNGQGYLGQITEGEAYFIGSKNGRSLGITGEITSEQFERLKQENPNIQESSDGLIFQINDDGTITKIGIKFQAGEPLSELQRSALEELTQGEKIDQARAKQIEALRKTTASEDVTLMIDGQPRTFQAFKGVMGKAGGFQLVDGNELFQYIPKKTEQIAREELLADEFYQMVGCFPKEKHIVTNDDGTSAIITKNIMFLNGFDFKCKEAAVQTFGIDVLLGNMDNVLAAFKNDDHTPIANLPQINLFHHPSGAAKPSSSVVRELSTLFKTGKNAEVLKRASKEELMKSLESVVNISDSQIRELVNKHGIENPDAMANLLIERKNFIARFLENMKTTEQDGLPIEEYVANVLTKTFGEVQYEKLQNDEKLNTTLTDYISEKFDVPKQNLILYKQLTEKPEFANYLKSKIEDRSLTIEDLNELRDTMKMTDFWRETPENQNKIFDILIDFKKTSNISFRDGYYLIYNFAQLRKLGSEMDTNVIDSIKEVSSVLGNFADLKLYGFIMPDGKLDHEALSIIQELQNKNIPNKYMLLMLSKLRGADGKYNRDLLKIVDDLVSKGIEGDNIPVHFNAMVTPDGINPSMSNYVEMFQNLGIPKDYIANLFLMIRVRNQRGQIEQRTSVLDTILKIAKKGEHPANIANLTKTLAMFPESMTIELRKAISKSPDNIDVINLNAALQACFKPISFNRNSYYFLIEMLEDGAPTKDLNNLISNTTVLATKINFLSPEQAEKQTFTLQAEAQLLFERGKTLDEVNAIIAKAKTNGVIDEFVLENLIREHGDKLSTKELVDLISCSKIVPDDKSIPIEEVNRQRSMVADAILEMYKNGYSGQEATAMITPALNIRTIPLSRDYTITGLNEKVFNFAKKCADNKVPAADVRFIELKAKIEQNAQNLTQEEMNAKMEMMLNWADKLLFEDKLPPKTVQTFMDIAAFKTNVFPVKTYNFDEKVVEIINQLIEEKVITPESPANLAMVIKAFKLQDYDENAINTAKQYLSNPITLENGKEYQMDAESLGMFIGASKNKETGKFDLEMFHKNAQLFILKADHGFSIQELAIMAKLYKGKLSIDRLSTGVKVNILNKLSYASPEALKLIREKVIDTKDDNDNVVFGDTEVLVNTLLANINIASRNIRTTQQQRAEFLRNFISNKGRNPETGLNDIETAIVNFDFTQYGKDGLPLKYSRDEFVANLHSILENLTPEQQAQVLKFHNIDLGDNGFNSNPRIRRLPVSTEKLTNAQYKQMFEELNTLLKGINENNIQLYKETSTDAILQKCSQLASLTDTQLSAIAKEYPELKFEDLKAIQQQAITFGELVANNDVAKLPTPLVVKTANDEIDSYSSFTTEMKEASTRIEEEYNKFVYENEFKTGNAEIDEIMNGIMRGLPDVMLTVGKKQHKTHNYSVDVHTMEVLKKAMSDPEYKTLSDKDRTILKFVILLHDFGKKYINPDTPDTGHEVDSAEIAAGILAQYKMPEAMKERILNIIKNHDWFARYNRNEWNANYVAALFRSPDDYKIAKIMSKADLASINNEFNYRVLGIDPQNRTPENYEAAYNKKLENVDISYNRLYSKTNIIMNSRILNPSKIPMDEQYGVQVLNLTDDAIPSDMDLGIYGMNGSTKENLRLTVHMVDDKNLLGNLESAKLGMETTINDNNTWSISIIRLNKKGTYKDREYGILTDAPLSSIAVASPYNIGSGYEKSTARFVELLFSDNNQHFLKQQFGASMARSGYRITEVDYQALSKMVYNKSFTTQIETKPEIEVNGRMIPTEVVVKAIQESTDALITTTPYHTEFVTTNPKIQGLVVKKRSMVEVNPDFIAFAKKYNLPIILIGK